MNPLHVRRFIAMLVIYAIPCFVTWALLSHVIAQPGVGLMNLIMAYWMPETIGSVVLDDSKAVTILTLGDLGGKLVSAELTDHNLSLMIGTQTLTYSLPFFASLHFASGRRAGIGNLLEGLVVLYAVFVFSLIATCLKDLYVLLGPQLALRTALPLPPPAVNALLYQLSVLMLPVLGPVAIWLRQSQSGELKYFDLLPVAPGEPTIESPTQE